MNIMLRHWGEKTIHIHSYPFISIHIHSYPFISIHSLHFIVFHCISLLSCQSCGRVCSKQANSQAPICHKSSLRTPGGTTSWIHWALRCPHGCLQEETNSCHWCVQLLQCLLGVPDWQQSLSNGKPGAAARGDGTLGFGNPRMPSHCHHGHVDVSKLGTPKSHGV